MSKKEYLTEINDFIKRLQKDFTIYKIILFGSRAAGTAREDSDVDLIIVSDDFEGMNIFKRGAKMYDYWKFMIPVDFICLTVKEFNALKKKISIVSTALEEGIILA
ncbi:MAG: nucleotidyltransferase domain-containing protein [Nanoarchaeota archaeon]